MTGETITRGRIAAVALVLFAAALATPAAHAAAPTTVTISYADSTFSGKVASRDADCKRGRKVKVLQAKPGPDSLVASDRTNRRGRWSARKAGAAGAFYARVRKAEGCKGDRSKQLITGIARVEISPAGTLLTGDGDTQQLRAIARDASDRAIPGLPAASWSSDEPGTVSVSSSGLAGAEAGSGSAQITAELANVASNPILATIAAPAPGALLLTDSQIVGDPVLSDPGAEPTFDSAFEVIVTGIALPAPGTLIVNTETKPIVGRVVSAEDLGSGQIELTLQMVTAEEAFPDLVIDETLDLSGAAVEVDPEIAADYNVERTGDTFTFTPKAATVARYERGSPTKLVGTPIGTSEELGPFRKCKGETTPGDGSLPVKLSAPPLFTVSFEPTLEILYSASDLERLAINLKPKVKVDAGLSVKAAFEGRIECRAELFVVRAPVGGALSFLVAGLIPIGVGVELQGKVNVADAGLSTKVETEGTAEAGISCPASDPEDDCTLFGSLDFATPKVTPEVNAPSIGDLRFEPSLSAFGYADLAIGNVFFPALRFDVAKAKAGAKLSGSFATKTSQLADAAYKSSYKVSLDASASLGERLEDAGRALGLSSITGASITATTELANSPTGTLTTNASSFTTGQTVEFNARLDRVDFFPGIGPYNVDRVVLVRNSGGTITEVDSEVALPGETEFELEYTAPGPGNVDEFYLFVVTNLIPFDLFALELARAEFKPLAQEDFPISAGGLYNCGVRTGGTVACWGQNPFGAAVPLSGTFAQVAAGNSHTCGIRTEGTVACWGNNSIGQSTPPGGTFAQITAGNGHTCGLRPAGTVACWGFNEFGQTSAPSGTFTQVSAGYNHTCAVRTDGTVACWGANFNGQSTPPSGTFAQVSAGGTQGNIADHTCGVRTDGTVACWGTNGSGQSTPPSGTFAQVSAGGASSCGVRTDGTVACWGNIASPPGGTFVQVSASFHACGVRTDGTVACWPSGSPQTTPPSGTFG